MAGFASTDERAGIRGDGSYRVITYDSDTDDHGTITTKKAIRHVSWTPYTKRASATITIDKTAGTIAIAGLTVGDKGSLLVDYAGGN